jgi:hypothetical protein
MNLRLFRPSKFFSLLLFEICKYPFIDFRDLKPERSVILSLLEMYKLPAIESQLAYLAANVLTSSWVSNATFPFGHLLVSQAAVTDWNKSALCYHLFF